MRRLPAHHFGYGGEVKSGELDNVSEPHDGAEWVGVRVVETLADVFAVNALHQVTPVNSLAAAGMSNKLYCLYNLTLKHKYVGLIYFLICVGECSFNV